MNWATPISSSLGRVAPHNPQTRLPPKPNIGALIMRIVFWGPLSYNYNEEPQNSIGNNFGPYSKPPTPNPHSFDSWELGNPILMRSLEIPKPNSLNPQSPKNPNPELENRCMQRLLKKRKVTLKTQSNRKIGTSPKTHFTNLKTRTKPVLPPNPP